MNELTRVASEGGSVRWDIVQWLTPILLAILSVMSFGNYSAVSDGNTSLTQLNNNVEETNRLAEMRGATAVEIKTLGEEVALLREKVLRCQTIDEAKDNFKIVKEALQTQMSIIGSKADTTILLEYMQAQRSHHERLSKRVDILANRVRVESETP